MRLILILWIIPIVVFWGWYGLSANDVSMGSIFFSRAFHDHMFRLYGSMLGVPPQEVPALIAGTFAFDTMLLMAMAAFRWHKKWFPQAKAWVLEMSGIASNKNQSAKNMSNDMKQFAIDMEQYSMLESATQTNEPARSTYPMHPAE